MSHLFLSDSAIVLQVLPLVGKTGVTGAYAIISLAVTELMPTVVRNMGMSIGATSGFLSSTFAPYILYTGKCFHNLIAARECIMFHHWDLTFYDVFIFDLF